MLANSTVGRRNGSAKVQRQKEAGEVSVEDMEEAVIIPAVPRRSWNRLSVRQTRGPSLGCPVPLLLHSLHEERQAGGPINV